jgi:hypothetical protein
MLSICEQNQTLHHGEAAFDPWTWSWRRGGPAAANGGVPIDAVEAMGLLFRRPACRRVPVAVIGPKNASPRQLEVAEALGRRLGELRVPMITGGKAGVMEAASRGCLAAGGLPIGILPDDEWTAANDFVAIPLATGLGSARNAVIARAAFALIAVGGEYGTLSEMAFGLHFQRLVLALEDAPHVPGAIRAEDIEAALRHIANRLFALEQ